MTAETVDRVVAGPGTARESEAKLGPIDRLGNPLWGNISA
jgi:hypothetical protein